jgi:hypothetical protein
LSHKHNKFHLGIEEFPISQLKLHVFISVAVFQRKPLLSQALTVYLHLNVGNHVRGKKKHHGVIASGAKHNSSIKLCREHST